MSMSQAIEIGDPALREFGAEHYMRLWIAQTLRRPDAEVYADLAKMLKPGEDGIFLKRRAGGLNWRWMQEVMDLDAHDAPKHQPVLHVPFSGAELAAHLLDGIGSILAGAYGGLDRAEPDVVKLGVTRQKVTQDDGHEEVIEVVVDGLLKRPVTALRRAWKAYHSALDSVGPRPQSAEQFVAGLPPNTRPSSAEIESVECRFQSDYPQWRRSMVAVLTSQGAGHCLAPKPELSNAPDTPSAKAATVLVHRLKNRRGDLLTPVLDRALGLAGGLDAPPSAVWAQLERLAASESPPAPLEGLTQGGVVYRDGSQKKTFTSRALGDRLRRLRQRRDKPR